MCNQCRGTATSAGLLLRSWNAGGDGNAAILFDWERNVLEAVFEGGGGFDLATQIDLDPEAEAQRRVGGPVDLKPGEQLAVGTAYACPMKLEVPMISQHSTVERQHEGSAC